MGHIIGHRCYDGIIITPSLKIKMTTYLRLSYNVTFHVVSEWIDKKKK